MGERGGINPCVQVVVVVLRTNGCCCCKVCEWILHAVPPTAIHHAALLEALDTEDIDGPALCELGASAITAQQALGVKFGAASALVNAIKLYRQEAAGGVPEAAPSTSAQLRKRKVGGAPLPECPPKPVSEKAAGAKTKHKFVSEPKRRPAEMTIKYAIFRNLAVFVIFVLLHQLSQVSQHSAISTYTAAALHALVLAAVLHALVI